MTTHRVLAGAALLLASLGLVVGDPPASRGAPVPRVFAWVSAYDSARVDAVTLAEWLRDRRRNLSILDVRPADAFRDFHLPRAVHMPLAELGIVPADSAATVVVYGDREPDAQRAWLVLSAFGHQDVRALEEGIRGWLVDVINPVLPRPTTPAEEIEFDRRADLSRYFGGLPRLGEPIDPTARAEDVLTRTRRRGCAF